MTIQGVFVVAIIFVRRSSFVVRVKDNTSAREILKGVLFLFVLHNCPLLCLKESFEGNEREDRAARFENPGDCAARRGKIDS